MRSIGISIYLRLGSTPTFIQVPRLINTIIVIWIARKEGTECAVYITSMILD